MIRAVHEACVLPVLITVTPVDIQDRDAACDVFCRLRLTQSRATQICADRGYSSELVDWARECLWLTLGVLSRPKGVKDFVILPGSRPFVSRQPAGRR
jgi:hypothetical protein